jgi:transcriptional regulator GlxA family with amidase domain
LRADALLFKPKQKSQVADFVVFMSWFYFERGERIRLEMLNGRDPAKAFRPKRVGLIGFDGVTALNLIAPADSFATTVLDDGYGNLIPCYEVHTIGVFSDRLRTESGLLFQAQHTLSMAPELDTIIIAGGRGILRPEVSDKIATWILKRINKTRRFGAVGTGVHALAATGLLNGHEVTTHWRFARELAHRFPRLKIDHRKPFVHDGPYYTSTGLSGGVNLALAMIGEDYGPHVARSMEEELSLRLTKEDQESTPPPVTSPDNYPIDRFSELVAWVMRNLNADLSVEVLARRTCMCPSHFSKVFKSILGKPPRDFVQNLRLNEARRRLLKRQKTLRTVSESVGFKTSLAFQEAFERKFGARPTTYLESRKPPKLAMSNGSH